MKSKEELDTLKREIGELKRRLAELTEEELAQVTGGHNMPKINPDEKYVLKELLGGPTTSE